MNSSIFGNSVISLGDSIFITVVSMAIVFFILVVISAVLSTFKYIPAEKKEVKPETKKPVAPTPVVEKRFSPEDIKDENMLVAMMVASIEAAKNNENAYIRVKSIKELN
ncbi:MAG: OadG family protein [Cetobacterium sp.]|uniref:Oxaloacetate decarboxylase, gamma chain n=1 Tax=Cetobacterium ceti TaxID=180163 RepID=A0A1T4KUZ4_9FUSO|nr:OadG family protein [Cetobacterium ceti]MCJ8342764.1 OadG family protein [Cetobacterium sp.]SJZ46262.1 Oxaloacetate decarboxylase, gamma chain [Cetobacterium ceti]